MRGIAEKTTGSTLGAVSAACVLGVSLGAVALGGWGGLPAAALVAAAMCGASVGALCCGLPSLAAVLAFGRKNAWRIVAAISDSGLGGSPPVCSPAPVLAVTSVAAFAPHLLAGDVPVAALGVAFFGGGFGLSVALVGDNPLWPFSVDRISALTMGGVLAAAGLSGLAAAVWMWGLPSAGTVNVAIFGEVVEAGARAVVAHPVTAAVGVAAFVVAGASRVVLAGAVYDALSANALSRGAGLAAIRVVSLPGEKIPHDRAQRLFTGDLVHKALAEGCGLTFGFENRPEGISAYVAGRRAAVEKASEALENLYGGECGVEALSEEEAAGLLAASEGQEAAALEAASSGTARDPEVRSVEDFKEEPLSQALSALERVEVRRGERACVEIHVEEAPRSDLKPLQKRRAKLAAKRERRGDYLKSVLIMPFSLLRDWFGVRGGVNNTSLNDDEKAELSEIDARLKEKRLYLVRPRAVAFTGGEADGAGEAVLSSYTDTFGGFANPSRGSPARRARGILRWGELTSRKAALLSASEVGALWHPLGQDARLTGLRSGGAMTLAPPAGMPAQGVFLGQSNHHRSLGEPVFLDAEDLLTHGRLTGDTGNGKSSVQLRIIESVLTSPGRVGKMGALVIDPKNGSLIEKVLSIVPDERLSDVAVIEPEDPDEEEPREGVAMNPFHPGLGGMQPSDQAEAFVGAIENVFPSGFGANMRPLFVNAAAALVWANVVRGEHGDVPPYTPMDLTETRFLAPRVEEDKDNVRPAPFREKVINELRTDPRFEELVEFWDNVDVNKKAADQVKEFNPVTNKIRHLSGSRAEGLLGTPGADIDPMKAMQEGRIVLLNMPKALMSGMHALVGTIFLNLVLKAAELRHYRSVKAGAEGSLREFALFIDEAQNFPCTQLVDILTEGRAYATPVWASHQYIAQLPDWLAKAYSNAATHMHFATIQEECKRIANFVGEPFTESSLTAMGAFNYVLFHKQKNARATCRTVPLPDTDASRVAAGRRASLTNYAGCGRRPAASPAVATGGGGESRPTGGSEDHGGQQHSSQGRAKGKGRRKVYQASQYHAPPGADSRADRGNLEVIQGGLSAGNGGAVQGGSAGEMSGDQRVNTNPGGEHPGDGAGRNSGGRRRRIIAASSSPGTSGSGEEGDREEPTDDTSGGFDTID